ncbi:ATP-dependent DNA helicase RecG [Raoultibacter massiliensis]|uniref:ATP-dependent DNA helicase RecG n=1 Tax=Raoultibacter massiliensis TaxID=1852371 RepID=UPI001FE2F6F7|nr:ATP-dependent DNA helicase RecG [Raoultibacter massiliensis]
MSGHSTSTPNGKAAGETSLDRLAATLAFDEPVSRVRLVSPMRAGALDKLGVRTIRDLLTHFPRRYIDMSRIADVARAPIGEMVTIAGTVHEIKLKKPKPKFSLVEIALTDQSGVLMITCFRQPWLMDQIEKGDRLAVSGKLEFNYGFKRMTNPFIEEVGDSFDEKTGRIIAVHPATEKITTAWMRRLVGNALDSCAGALDPLPIELRTKYRLPSRMSALSAIHFPTTMAEVGMARRRLVYEEVLMLELHLMMDEMQRSEGKPTTAHVTDGAHRRALEENLPFTLTDEQVSARDDILRVMESKQAANHMLLGDVGTGKTIVASFALAAVADTGTQAAMMAPTEVLTRQYAEKLGPLLDAAGITWEVLTGSTGATEREAIIGRVAQGTVDVLFGTHALLEDDVRFADLTLAVIDEQQRFGVDQRASLLAKGQAPDALYMTATPIPRTLALALYGSLTLSYIKNRPLNAAGNETKVYSRTERGRAYDAALAALAEGHQVYVVCPLVGKPHPGSENERKAKRENDLEADDEYEYAVISIEDEADIEDDAKAAVREARFLQEKTFVDYKVDLLHGKMSGAEKQEAMERFRSGESQVLVATTVIEVGVDVPNATVMIIEDAERFGLSQLHQLRGRVGRGTEPGEVYLISGSKAPCALERLAAMEKTEDGFELASYDLSLRREGDILGNRQHGASVLKLVNVVRDGKIIEAAHADARAMLAEDAGLRSDRYRALGREVRLAFRGANEVKGG